MVFRARSHSKTAFFVLCRFVFCIKVQLFSKPPFFHWYLVNSMKHYDVFWRWLQNSFKHVLYKSSLLLLIYDIVPSFNSRIIFADFQAGGGTINSQQHLRLPPCKPAKRHRGPWERSRRTTLILAQNGTSQQISRNSSKTSKRGSSPRNTYTWTQHYV